MQVSEVIWWNWDAALQGLQTIATVMYYNIGLYQPKGAHARVKTKINNHISISVFCLLTGQTMMDSIYLTKQIKAN